MSVRSRQVKVAIDDYLGSYTLDLSRSDSPEPYFQSMNYPWSYRCALRSAKQVLTISKESQTAITVRTKYHLKEGKDGIEEVWMGLVDGAQFQKMTAVDGAAYMVQYKWNTFDNTMEIKSYLEDNAELVLSDFVSLIDSGNALRRCMRIGELELNLYYLRINE